MTCHQLLCWHVAWIIVSSIGKEEQCRHLNPALKCVASKYSGLYVQCRHLIPALNGCAARAQYTTTHPIVSESPGHTCIDNITTESSFDQQSYLGHLCT